MAGRARRIVKMERLREVLDNCRTIEIARDFDNFTELRVMARAYLDDVGVRFTIRETPEAFVIIKH